MLQDGPLRPARASSSRRARRPLGPPTACCCWQPGVNRRPWQPVPGPAPPPYRRQTPPSSLQPSGGWRARAHTCVRDGQRWGRSRLICIITPPPPAGGPAVTCDDLSSAAPGLTTSSQPKPPPEKPSKRRDAQVTRCFTSCHSVTSKWVIENLRRCERSLRTASSNKHKPDKIKLKHFLSF